jgi:hypothetical protein
MEITDDGLLLLLAAIVKSAPKAERIEYAWLAEVLIADPTPKTGQRASKDVTDLWIPSATRRKGNRRITRPDRRGQSIQVSVKVGNHDEQTGS